MSTVRPRALRRGFISALVAFALIGLTATPLAAQDIGFARFDVARYGAACLLGSSSIDLPGRGIIVTYDTILQASGVPRAVTERWANDRNREHEIAVAVLQAEKDGDTFVDPPEPFLYILRQAQTDCQDYHRSLNVLSRIEERTIAQGQTIPPFQAWRLNDDYADSMHQERLKRLMNVILTGKQGIDAGYGVEVARLASIIARRDVALEILEGDYNSQTARALAVQLLND